MTNNQAAAYAELAARFIGLSEDKILELVLMMREMFDFLTEEEAEAKSRY
ncbi:MAG TPA: hypothetical protein GX517_13695 [Alicyclobacillus sp.]|nr:hypothetical protein [Alicyclobacillus sp.]